MCLFAAFLVGLLAAVAAIVAGWHPLAALSIYSLAGSSALVAATMIVRPGVEPGPATLSVEALSLAERAPA
jgi:hypothetical protein